MKSYYWYRLLLNTHEPNNTIKVSAEIEGKYYVPFAVSGFVTFTDGSSVISIQREENGLFSWKNGDKEGMANSFDEAWEEMPALITDPDDWEESPVYPV